MSFVVDTDICSAYLKGDRDVFTKFVQYGGGLYVSAITAGELYAWIGRHKTALKYRQGVLDMLAGMTLIPIDGDVAERFGDERASLLDRGVVVPPTDLFIASTALHHNFTLVTHNVKHFSLVKGLRIEDWQTP